MNVEEFRDYDYLEITTKKKPKELTDIAVALGGRNR